MNKQKELQRLVSANPHFEFAQNGKIRCLLTNHEILPTQKDFEAYLQSKSYRRGVESDFNFAQFAPYIEDHKKDKNKLFCNLTKQAISKKKSAVLKHVNGKRYKHYLQLYQDELNKQEKEHQDGDDQDQIEIFEHLQKENQEQQQGPRRADKSHQSDRKQKQKNLPQKKIENDNDEPSEEVQPHKQSKKTALGILKNGKKISKKPTVP